MNNIGYLIKINRERKGYSMNKLSKISGVSTGLISKYENGITIPGYKNVCKICKALNINIGELGA